MPFLRPLLSNPIPPNPYSLDDAIAQPRSLHSPAARNALPSWKRRLPALILLLLAAFTLSGCVYLRLLKFKHQLKDFDTFVEVRADEGLALVLRKPLLLDSDFVFLTESQPNWIKTPHAARPDVEQWGWLFEKQLGETGDKPFEIGFTTSFANGELIRIDFDPQLLRAIPKGYIVELFRSLGKARINKFRRSATATVSGDSLPDIPLPSLREIEQIMGPPTDWDFDPERLNWRYTFNFHNPETGEIAGQFRLVFQSQVDHESDPIMGFELTGKAR